MCEFCGNDKDIIFPFQLNKCQRCEGEPSLLAGLGGLRTLSPRPPTALSWRDWKFSNPRRLERELTQDRRAGEGGEDLAVEEGSCEGVDELRSREQEEMGDTGVELIDRTEARQESRGMFHSFTPGRLMRRGAEEEEEEELNKRVEESRKDECVEVYSDERARCEKDGNGQKRRENVSLLKVLHIDRLTKSISTRDRRESSASDSETRGSSESLEEVGIGKDRKNLLKLSSFEKIAKGFLKRAVEGERKSKMKEEECEEVLQEKGKETVREGKVKDETPDKGEGEDGTGKMESGVLKQEKFPFMKLLKPHQLSSIFSRERSRAEGDVGEESGCVREVDAGEEGQKEAAVTTAPNWRARRSRNARRLSRGRREKEEGVETD